MAYLTEAQKHGLNYLLKDYPLQKSGKIDLNMVRPMRTYEIPPEAEQFLPKDIDLSKASDIGLYGMNESLALGEYVQPKGNPSGLYKERGVNPFPYVSNLEEFGMATGPKPDEQGKLNARIANAIAHETRHQYFSDNPELLEDLNVTALGNDPELLEEEYNRWLDMVAGGPTLSEGDVYQNDRLRAYFNMDRPGQGPFRIKDLEKIFQRATKKYKDSLRTIPGPMGRSTRSPSGGLGALGIPGRGGADLSPGGGYGQSPTGSDIAGTPFSRGGILGVF